MRKKSYEEVYELFKSKGLELLDKEYINCETKMNCIDEEGYTLTIRYDNLKSGKIPSRFHLYNPYTIVNIHHYIKLNRENVKLIRGQSWIGNKEHLTFKCLIHNETFPCSWGHFQNGSGCPKCGNNVISDKLKLNIPIIKQRIIDMGRDSEVELISTEYINNSIPLIFECKKHNILYNQVWNNFQTGKNGCEICYSDIRGGENHHNWKGGITPLHNHIRENINSWKYASFNKHNKSCDITGIKSDKNIIHHLHPFYLILQEAINTLQLQIHQEINQYTDIELKSIEDLCLELHYKYGLGVCLSENIHKEFHSVYGTKNNTKEQYIEFKEMKLKQLNILKLKEVV